MPYEERKLIEAFYPTMRKQMALKVGDTLVFEGVTLDILEITDTISEIYYTVQEQGSEGMMSWTANDMNLFLAPAATVVPSESE